MAHVASTSHRFGRWSPPRFIPTTVGPPGSAPAFYIVTHRVCTGEHDLMCTETQTQLFGPLRPLDGADEAWVCPDCRRVQAPSEDLRAEPLCLSCTDAITVQHSAAVSAHAGLSAVAAFFGASETLALAERLGDEHTATLLEGTGESLRIILDNAHHLVRANPERLRHKGMAELRKIADRVLKNAKKLAKG